MLLRHFDDSSDARGARAFDGWATLNGLHFHFLDYGGSGQGQPIVLLHGLASSAHIWDRVAPYLRGARIVALDQRGHGLTAKPDDGYTLAAFAEDLAAFVNALALEHPIIIGHSMGGNVALEYAARAAAANAPLAGLALVDGGYVEVGARHGNSWERAEIEMTPPNWCGITRAQAETLIREWLGPAWNLQNAHICAQTLHVRADNTLCPNLSRAHHLALARSLWEQRVGALYPAINSPVLIVAAVQGTVLDTSAPHYHEIQRAVAALRDCRVTHLFETTHDIPLHRPRELGALLSEFIDRLAKPQRAMI